MATSASVNGPAAFDTKGSLLPEGPTAGGITPYLEHRWNDPSGTNGLSYQIIDGNEKGYRHWKLIGGSTNTNGIRFWAAKDVPGLGPLTSVAEGELTLVGQGSSGNPVTLCAVIRATGASARICAGKPSSAVRF